MTEKETFKRIAEKTGVTQKEIREVIHAYHYLIQDEIRSGNKFTILGLGTAYPKVWTGRKGRNPKTGEELDLKDKKTVGFRPSTTFVDELNK